MLSNNLLLAYGRCGGTPKDKTSSMKKLTIRSNEAYGASKSTNNEIVSSKTKMKDQELRINSVTRMN